MVWHRNDYLDLLTFSNCGRQMFVELFGLLTGLEAEWKSQGASADELDLSAFGFDYVPVAPCGGNTGVSGGKPPQIIKRTREYIIQTDEMGRQTKLFYHKASVPLPLNYPVSDMDSWLKIKPLFTYHEKRIDWDQVYNAKTAQKNGSLVTARIFGGFDLPRQLLGDVGACLCFMDQPELLSDILQTAEVTAIEVLDRISDNLTIDNLFVHEDMAGKSGPLIGPEHFRQFITPYYAKIWDMLSSKGTRLFVQDSDGNMKPLIKPSIEGGINVMLPLEPAASMDMTALRKQWKKTVAFKGGIDKHALRQTKEDIRRELEYKLQPLMQTGGTVFGLDHRIPNGTPLNHYRYYVRTAREILGLPPSKTCKWQRMAF